MNRRLIPFFILLLALGISACGLGSGGEQPCNEDGSLFSDAFEEGRNCGWALYTQSGTAVSIKDGTLQISASQPGQVWWSNPGRNFNDTIITVQARQVSGPNDNAYGVICRYQNEENFYIFLISGDGFYAIGKYQSGNNQPVYLTGDGQYQFSDAINQGAATNQIRVGCVGNELSLAINGIPVATVTDPTFVTGDIGMGGSTFEPGTAVIQFDNIRVVAP